MPANLASYRSDPQEVERVSRLLELMPQGGRIALDIGARDGHLSRLMAERFEKVVALDLEAPQIDHPRVDCVKGDVTQLKFADRCFDLVLCAEVLEHIPRQLLSQAAQEIVRVTGGAAVIGVPNRQDLRLHSTTCRTCGKTNPPYGHINSFSDKSLAALFRGLRVTSRSYVGTTRAATNPLSAALMSYSGHPFGTYDQDEPCVYCHEALLRPLRRTPIQRAATRLAHWCNAVQNPFVRERGNWLHMRLERIPSSSAPP